MKKQIILSLILLGATGSLLAQEPAGKAPPGEREFGREGDRGRGFARGLEGDRGRAASQPSLFLAVLYPPELVMRNAGVIGLTDGQKSAIDKLMPQSLGEAQDQQRTEAKQLEKLLKNDPVDETQALAQLDKLVQLENGFKRKQLGTLIKIKNLLTPEQKSKLDDLKRQATRRTEGEPQFGPREGGSHEGGEPRFGPREGERRTSDNAKRSQ